MREEEEEEEEEEEWVPTGSPLLIILSPLHAARDFLLPLANLRIVEWERCCK